MQFRTFFLFTLAILFVAPASGQDNKDLLREFQYRAAELGTSDWIHWGDQPGKFSNWTNHSNRLIPVYTFGVTLDSIKGENSIYRDEQRLTELYGCLLYTSPSPRDGLLSRMPSSA